jgi:hypothetical protein
MITQSLAQNERSAARALFLLPSAIFGISRKSVLLVLRLKPSGAPLSLDLVKALQPQ